MSMHRIEQLVVTTINYTDGHKGTMFCFGEEDAFKTALEISNHKDVDIIWVEIGPKKEVFIIVDNAYVFSEDSIQGI